MILNDSLSFNLKTKLSSEAHDKSCELSLTARNSAFAEKCIFTEFYLISFWKPYIGYYN